MCNHNNLIELDYYIFDDWNFKVPVRFEAEGEDKVLFVCKDCGQVFCKNMKELYDN